ncbi:MAG TPA: DUF1003 domain-containing protein [Bryobacteraceae bacterium]|nr:DUF1003 domain-containing protein [Bryobacteraceae bacterium]
MTGDSGDNARAAVPLEKGTAVRQPALAHRNILAISALEEQALARRTRAETLGDRVAFHAGQLWFIVSHALFIGIWICWNSALVPFGFKFDPFPWPALNTIVSLEAIFLALFILMSQNRSTRRAEERAHLDLQINLLAEYEATKMLRMLQALCAAHKLPEALDPEVRELLERTDPAALAQELERKLPSDGAARADAVSEK